MLHSKWKRWYSFYSQRKRLKLPRLQAEATFQLNIRPAKTVAITILAFIACYTPPALIAAWLSRPVGSTSVAWPGHLAFSCIFSTSAINPVIYCFRARKFRRALKQLLQDPCGKTAFLKTNHKQQVNRMFHVWMQEGLQKARKLRMNLKRPEISIQPVHLFTSCLVIPTTAEVK